MIYVFFNPLSNNKKGTLAEIELRKIFAEKELEFVDITTVKNAADELKKLNEDDEIVIAGGDGTLTRFADDIYDIKNKQKIFLYPCGSGNDFFNDIKSTCEFENKLVPLNKYLESLPEVSVNGIKRHFINGIGYGIDGYCCEEGDRIRSTSDKKVNYTLIALKGLLFKFKARNATITVDGETKSYKKVWLAPTMIGRFYGGGMMITPMQDRLNKEKLVTAAVCHSATKFKILSVFPKVYKGNHISHTEILEFRTGHEVTVEFDKPTALQIDGETVRNVISYSVKYH